MVSLHSKDDHEATGVSVIFDSGIQPNRTQSTWILHYIGFNWNHNKKYW